MNPEAMDLWDQLEQALDLQAVSLRRGDWKAFESALDRSVVIVDRISGDDQVLRSLSESRRRRLGRTYERLMLMAEAQKETISQQLHRVRSSRRTLDAYQPYRSTPRVPGRGSDEDRIGGTDAGIRTGARRHPPVQPHPAQRSNR
jgi:hypothetical protein